MVRLSLIAYSLFFLVAAAANEFTGCEPLVLKKNGPPLDYNDPSAAARERMRMVEGAHFTKSVRAGVAGNAGSLVGDLNYVLNVFPNHPYALALMAELQQKPGFSRQKSMRRDSYYPTTSCYFQRALQIAPADPNVYLVLAIHQHKHKKYEDAKASYLKALTIKPDAADAHYNLGLLFLTLGEVKQALTHAQSAYALGYPLPALREKLQHKGVWQEPKTASSDSLPDSGS